VPLAAVLWSGEITFAGVLSFLLADLIVLPILASYRKYYGSSFAVRITIAMFIAMAIAALITSAVLGGLGAIPSGPRPARAGIFGTLSVNYKLALNVLATLVSVAVLCLSGSLPKLRAPVRARPGLDPRS
jgi:hypothetical protein